MKKTITICLLCAANFIGICQETSYTAMNYDFEEFKEPSNPNPGSGDFLERLGELINLSDKEQKERALIKRKLKRDYKIKDLKKIFDTIEKHNYIGYTNKVPFGIPVLQLTTKDSVKISSNYGYRKHPILKAECFHQGMDFSAKKGSYVIATADGRVTIANTKNKYHGKYIRVEHDYNFTSQYSHLDRILVEKGNLVKKGDTIGYVGSTGRATGPHLHYEIHKNKMHIDPLSFIQRKKL